MTRVQVVQILTSLAVATAGCLLLSPTATHPYRFEVEVFPSSAGRLQVFYDIGRTINESDSVSIRFAAGNGPLKVSLPLPEGRYRSLRIDPIDREAAVSFRGPRIVGADGRSLFEVKPEALLANDDIRSVEIREGIVTVHPKPGTSDPFLKMDLVPALDLRSTWLFRAYLSWKGILGSAILLWLLQAAVHGSLRHGNRIVEAAHRNPQASLMILALAAGIGASYPVVFLGRSYVSPNVGTALLYSNSPTVPGYDDGQVWNMHGSDVGAVMWAHLPYSTVQARALLDDGELPLWNRYNSSGNTLLGQGQSMWGDPLHLFVIAARGANWAWDVKFVLAKALFAAGLGLCVWRLTRDLPASMIITLAAPFIALFNFRFNHPAVFSVAYSPWVLCAWMQMTSTEGRRLAAGLLLWTVANVALIGSGTVKEAYVSLAALNATGAFHWMLSPPVSKGSKLRIGLIIAAAGVLNILITMPLWRTFLEAMQTSGTVYDMPQAWRVPRAWLIGFFDDFFYRELNPQHLFYVPAANFVFFLGAVWALAQPLRLSRHRAILVILTGCVVSILIGFEYAPRAWILAVPILRNVHYLHAVFIGIAIVHLAILAGWGMHAARIPLVSRRGWLPAAITAGVMLAWLFVVYFRDIPGVWTKGRGVNGWWGLLPNHGFFYASVALMIAACVYLSFLAARRLRGKSNGVLLQFLGLLALGLLLYRHGLHVAPPSLSDLLTSPMVRSNLTAPSPAVTFVLDDTSGPFRVAGTDYNLIPGFASVYGIEGINGPDALMNPRYREFAEASGLTDGRDWYYALDRTNLAARRPFLSFLGVRYLLTPSSQLEPGSGFVKARSLDLEVFRNDEAWPRAFFTDGLDRYDTPADFTSQLKARAARPFASAQTGDPGVPAGLPVPAGDIQVVPARDYRLTANTTTFRVAAPSAGFVVLQETWLRDDFRATLNGAPVDYFRVNHAFKGLRIPAAGEYLVTFSFWPGSLTTSLWLSSSAAFALAILITWQWRRIASRPELPTG